MYSTQLVINMTKTGSEQCNEVNATAAEIKQPLCSEDNRQQ